MTKLPKDRSLSQGLQAIALGTLLKPDATMQAEVTDFRYVGSYNWVNSPTPTIIVPGSPPRWIDRPTPFWVPHDSGVVFVDQNGYRMKNMPLVPLIKAVELMSNSDHNRSSSSNPDSSLGPVNMDWRAVDFVTDRSNLRKLLRWIDESTGRAFRIDTQLAGNGTVLLNRWEKRTREYGQATSYGFNLEGATTRLVVGCEGSTSHHRIVKYDFGGLRMVVRFEVDAFVPPAPSDTPEKDRLEALDALKVAIPPPAPSEMVLNVRTGGSIIPQSSLIELKSASEKSAARGNWAEVYPQLYLSQTPWLYKAVHIDGKFHTVNKMGLGSLEIVDVAEKSKLRFERLRQALQNIKDMVVEAGPDGRLSLVLEERELKVYERQSQESCLPADVMAIFERTC